ncbi:LLM class flavin-dependent oxidoreductase, partial [Ralstonia pseudosolanacearum]|uniref:LLM class flavin-dependent oxidoreductase n=1 Tax=Ralstonia pseudosolanacearum TaxID=1310165 RepID=UPI0020057274
MIKSWIFEQVNVSTSADAGLFDAATFQHELGWRQRTWIDAEALGFHGIFFSEHHFSGVRVSPCPSMLAAAVAARTTVLRIGVLGWVLPLWQPWRFLEKVGMLDHLSQGRLEIGVARGSNPLEAEAVGVAVEDVGPMFDEALDILDKAWTEPTLSHRGRGCVKTPRSPRLEQRIQVRWSDEAIHRRRRPQAGDAASRMP